MAQLIRLRDKYAHVIVEAQDQLLEFGRQDVDETPPLAVRPMAGGQRLVVAELHNTTVGRRQLRLERMDAETVRLTNLHSAISVSVEGKDLSPACSLEVRLPVDVRISSIQLRLENAATASPGAQFQTLFERPALSGSSNPVPSTITGSLRADLKQGDPQSLLYRLEQLVVVLQASASSPDFMQQVARSAVELIELDHGAVVLWKEDHWANVATATAGLVPDSEWTPSRSLLNLMRTNRRTTWSSPQQAFADGAQPSLMDVVAYVAAPILNPQGEVIGAVYGDRRTELGGLRQPIEQVDAQLVEIFACGIAGGLQRLDKEQEVLARRIQLEQFVNPEVARIIEQDPDWLSGRDADVTMLFCDIQGFSRISEKLSPRQTFEWINDVMMSLSECVKQFGGTIVDYVGDEVIAMWGAPFAAENQASAACHAAIAMFKSLSNIDTKWQPITQSPTHVGVGINSGRVRVGNTGCQLKLKYGPLGSAVNIASRVQGATRYLRTPILITGATAAMLHDEFPIRRLCQLRVKNIEAPIDIFEVSIAIRDDWGARCRDYALALADWEQGKIQDAVNSLSQIVATYRDDVPALVMLSRAIEVWSNGQTNYDPVWTLSSK